MIFKWIPVETRMPTACGAYLVTYECPDGRYTRILAFNPRRGWECLNQWDSVTAWAEIPEAYRKEAANE